MAHPTPELQRIAPFWDPNAACRGLTDLFFPDMDHMTRSMMVRTIDTAKEVCRTQCPVLDACRDYALSHGFRHGVWAGMTEKEMRRERKRLNITVVSDED